MCHFITAVLPKSVPVGELDVIARAHGRQLKPLANQSIEGQIEASEAYFLTATGHCDCGTPLGALNCKARSGHNHESEERKLRQKGWSAAKIARSLSQKEDHERAAERVCTEATVKGTQSWLDLLSAALQSRKTNYIGLLLHMYDGSLADSIELQGREVVVQSGISPAVLGQMKEDVLYEFRAGA